MSHSKLLINNLTIDSLLTMVKKVSLEVNDNGGLDFAFDNEKSEAFRLYELIVKLIDDVFYVICERDNLSIDKYYPIFESAIKNELPSFTY